MKHQCYSIQRIYLSWCLTSYLSTRRNNRICASEMTEGLDPELEGPSTLSYLNQGTFPRFPTCISSCCWDRTGSAEGRADRSIDPFRKLQAPSGEGLKLQVPKVESVHYGTACFSSPPLSEKHGGKTLLSNMRAEYIAEELLYAWYMYAKQL